MTATLGTPTFAVQVLNAAGDANYHQIINTALDVTASNSQNWNMVPGAVFTDSADYLTAGIWLKAGWLLRIFDTATIDAVVGDTVVHIRSRQEWI